MIYEKVLASFNVNDILIKYCKKPLHAIECYLFIKKSGKDFLSNKKKSYIQPMKFKKSILKFFLQSVLTSAIQFTLHTCKHYMNTKWQ